MLNGISIYVHFSAVSIYVLLTVAAVATHICLIVTDSALTACKHKHMGHVVSGSVCRAVAIGRDTLPRCVCGCACLCVYYTYEFLFLCHA